MFRNMSMKEASLLYASCFSQSLCGLYATTRLAMDVKAALNVLNQVGHLKLLPFQMSPEFSYIQRILLRDLGSL
jgi:hypothetical protein